MSGTLLQSPTIDSVEWRLLSPKRGPRSDQAPGSWSLRTLFDVYRSRLLLTYALFNVENLVALGTPWALGCAIDGLLRSWAPGLLIFAVQQLLFLALGAARRTYDARVFARIYSDLATRLVLDQRDRNVEISRVAARSALSREVVSFFERDVPCALQASYATVGGLMMLAFHDGMLLPLGMVLMIPVFVLSRFYGRKTYLLNGHLNDELEREVDVITTGSPRSIRGHYDRVGGCNIRLANWEAVNFGLLDLCTLALLTAALVRTCLAGHADPGRILMVFGYVQMFVSGLLSLPMLVRQASRLRDICRRLG
jgi:ABC-type multidrug transport system fused ATPase/permease subunit